MDEGQDRDTTAFAPTAFNAWESAEIKADGSEMFMEPKEAASTGSEPSRNGIETSGGT